MGGCNGEKEMNWSTLHSYRNISQIPLYHIYSSCKNETATHHLKVRSAQALEGEIKFGVISPIGGGGDAFREIVL